MFFYKDDHTDFCSLLSDLKERLQVIFSRCIRKQKMEKPPSEWRLAALAFMPF